MGAGDSSVGGGAAGGEEGSAFGFLAMSSAAVGAGGGGRKRENEETPRLPQEPMNATDLLDVHRSKYDVGVYSNIAQVMGSKNPLTWLLPFVESYEKAEKQAGLQGANAACEEEFSSEEDPCVDDSEKLGRNIKCH